MNRLRTHESIPFGFLHELRDSRSYRSAWWRMNALVRFLTIGILVAGILIRSLRRQGDYCQSLFLLCGTPSTSFSPYPALPSSIGQHASLVVPLSQIQLSQPFRSLSPLLTLLWIEMVDDDEGRRPSNRSFSHFGCLMKPRDFDFWLTAARYPKASKATRRGRNRLAD